MRFFLTISLASFSIAQLNGPSYVTLSEAGASIEILQGDPDDPRLSPGLWFITPFHGSAHPTPLGPQIFNNHGNLIWAGNSSADLVAQSAHVCQFRSPRYDTLCFSDAGKVGNGGHSMGSVKFLSNDYSQIASYGAVNGLGGPDSHELEAPATTDGETFIQDVFEPMSADLSGFGGPVDGYVYAGCFQERNSTDGAVLFQWCSYPNIPLEKTYVYMSNQSLNTTNPIGGNGTRDDPWDYAHINSISKTDEGDFIVSLRHLNAIFKVAGSVSPSGSEPGSILWQLGGKDPTIKSLDFNSSKQHAVRWRKTEGNSTTITLFDNATDGVRGTNTSRASSGKEIMVDTANKTATLVHQYDQPEGRLSSAQGMIQWLDNGNVAIGWGRIGFYSEFTRDGELLYHAQYGHGALQSYRIWKSQWHATPHYPPTLVLYAQRCDAALWGYASWNGATEVDSFRFYKSDSDSGPWKIGSVVQKTGFEVESSLGGFAQYGYVEALDKAGKVIGMSPVTKVFVPSRDLTNCTEKACGQGTDYSTGGLSRADKCTHHFDSSQMEQENAADSAAAPTSSIVSQATAHTTRTDGPTARSPVPQGRPTRHGLTPLPPPSSDTSEQGILDAMSKPNNPWPDVVVTQWRTSYWQLGGRLIGYVILLLVLYTVLRNIARRLRRRVVVDA